MKPQPEAWVSGVRLSSEVPMQVQEMHPPRLVSSIGLVRRNRPKVVKYIQPQPLKMVLPESDHKYVDGSKYSAKKRSSSHQ
jgi:hypothetical protein